MKIFMSRFGSDPQEFFTFVYGDTPPWDIGRPQPAMSRLIDRYPPAGPILDVGCGSGDLAIYLAQLGHPVTGVDFVEAAIDRAREKAGLLPPETMHLLDFQVADASKPSLLRRHFGAVVDSGFYHLFELDECSLFVDELSQVLLPGGRYYLHAFAIEFSQPNLPRRVSAEEILTQFTVDRGWKILEVRSVEFLSRVAPPVPAVCACIERLPVSGAGKGKGDR
jgi:SAM-dependent methyltransferase